MNRIKYERFYSYDVVASENDLPGGGGGGGGSLNPKAKHSYFDFVKCTGIYWVETHEKKKMKKKK